MKRAPFMVAGLFLVFFRPEANAQGADWHWEQCFPRLVLDEVNMCSNPRLARDLYEALARDSSPPRRVQLRPPPWPPLLETHSTSGRTYCYRQEVFEPNAPSADPVIYSCVWFRLSDERGEWQPRQPGRVPSAVPFRYREP